jgi:hypothetical protein
MKISSIRSVLLTIALAFIIWAAILLGVDKWIPWLLERWKSPRTQFPPLLLTAVACSALATILWALLLLPPIVRRWSNWRTFNRIDLAFFLLLFLFAISALLADRYNAYTVISIALGLTLVYRLYRHFRLERNPQQEDDKGVALFEKVLGEGFAPLEDLAQDKLERWRLADALEQIVRKHGKNPITVGLEGAWGSGKTTILRELQRRLLSQHLAVLYLTAWSYREPERLVLAYFSQLRGVLGKSLLMPGSWRSLHSLTAGLIEIGTGRFAGLFKPNLDKVFEESTDDLRNELRATLSQLQSPVVILLDDLDRLDGDELKGVIRAIRLVGDLPGIVHILAYDREQLSKIIFPNDPLGLDARDYLGKVINLELAIGAPPRDLAQGLIEESLQPLFDSVGEDALEDFNLLLLRNGFELLAEALPTPREIRRVAASTALVWQGMSRHLNLFDLFVLEIIHYRFPRIYDTLRAHPEWFYKVEWSGGTRRILGQEQWKADRDKFLRKIRESEGREFVLVDRLLRMLFPYLGDDLLARSESEEGSRRQRRMLHPAIYERYFHFYVPSKSITEAEMEDFAEEVKQASPGKERQMIVCRKVQGEARSGRFESFWQQWGLAFRSREETLATEFVHDVVAGVALCSTYLFDHEVAKVGDFRASAAIEVVKLALKTDTSTAATEVLADAIKHSVDLGFAGYIVHWADLDNRSEDFDSGDRIPDLQVLRDAISFLIAERFEKESGMLLQSDRDSRAAAIRFSADRDALAKLLTRELEGEPSLLPRLLELAAPMMTSPDYGKPAVEGFDPDRFKDLPWRRISEVTDSQPLDAWDNDSDKALVAKFREWIARPVKPAASAPSPE